MKILCILQYVVEHASIFLWVSGISYYIQYPTQSFAKWPIQADLLSRDGTFLSSLQGCVSGRLDFKHDIVIISSIAFGYLHNPHHYLVSTASYDFHHAQTPSRKSLLNRLHLSPVHSSRIQGWHVITYYSPFYISSVARRDPVDPCRSAPLISNNLPSHEQRFILYTLVQ